MRAAGFGLAFLLTLAHRTAAQPDATFYSWSADPISRGGTTVGCGLSADAMLGADTYVTINLSLAVEKHESLALVKPMTMLKVTATQVTTAGGFKGIPITLHGAWIKSGRGSTVGKLKSALPPGAKETYFLGVAPGVDLFNELLGDILNQGVTVGIQEKPNAIDRTLRIPKPTSVTTALEAQECFRSLEQQLQSHREGER